jgi:hypothetical protein
MHRKLLLALGLLVSLTAATRADQIILNWHDSGWYDGTGLHASSNKNYIAGTDGITGTMPYHNYFVFNLGSVSGTVLSAQLRLNTADQNGPQHAYSVFDVSTSIATLMSSNSGQVGIFNDLGSGALLATHAGPHSDNTIIDVNFNAAGLAYINGATGGLIAFGGDYIGAAGVNNYLFGGSGLDGQVRQLILEVQAVPAPAGVVLAGVGLVCAAGYSWLRRRKARLAV